MNTRKISFWMVGALCASIALAPLVRAEDKPEDKPKNPRPERRERAERAPRAGGAGADRLTRLAEELKLSDDQKTKIGSILKEETEKLRALREDANLAAEEKRNEVRDVRKDVVGKVKDVLDAEQFAKWEKIRSEGPARRARPAAPAGDPGGNAPKPEEKK